MPSVCPLFFKISNINLYFSHHPQLSGCSLASVVKNSKQMCLVKDRVGSQKRFQKVRKVLVKIHKNRYKLMNDSIASKPLNVICRIRCLCKCLRDLLCKLTSDSNEEHSSANKAALISNENASMAIEVASSKKESLINI